MLTMPACPARDRRVIRPAIVAWRNVWAWVVAEGAQAELYKAEANCAVHNEHGCDFGKNCWCGRPQPD